MAGRKSRPANLKLIEGRGNGTDSGGRKVKKPPGFKRLPPPKPDDLSPDAEILWDQIVEELPRLQLLKPLDGAALRAVCETYATLQQAIREIQENGITAPTARGTIGVAPWVRVQQLASRDFRAWCDEFGLTPSAEMRLAKGESDGDDEGNPFAGGAS